MGVIDVVVCGYICVCVCCSHDFPLLVCKHPCSRLCSTIRWLKSLSRWSLWIIRNLQGFKWVSKVTITGLTVYMISHCRHAGSFTLNLNEEKHYMELLFCMILKEWESVKFCHIFAQVSVKVWPLMIPSHASVRLQQQLHANALYLLTLNCNISTVLLGQFSLVYTARIIQFLQPKHIACIHKV